MNAKLSTPSKFIAATVVLLVVGLSVFAITTAGSAPTTIEVTFSPDGKGITVTSNEDIASVFIEMCGKTHRHSDLDGRFFTHAETQRISSVVVASGDHVGERFDNPSVRCSSAPAMCPMTTGCPRPRAG